MKKPGGQLQYKVKIEWSSNFAYAIGLIASDGCLHKDGRHIDLVSKDLQQILNFKTALRLENKINPSGRGGELEKNYHRICFGDKNFYLFLNSIGLTHAKSRTIQKVEVPDVLFPDFLRGLFDGDGSFYSTWDKRWPNSLVYRMSFASASKEFIAFLKQKLLDLYNISSYFHKGKGVWEVICIKAPSRKLVEVMYYAEDILFLSRKYDKIKNILELDQELRLPSKPVEKVFKLISTMPR